MTSQGIILLADDEETFLEATKDLLEEEGYDCHGVRNATELSNALAALEFDLLITDLNMPGNRIMETVGALREQTKIMPVIVVTGYPSVPTAVESVRLNVLEYMIKPLNFPTLLAAVKRGIQHKTALGSLTQARRESAQRLKALENLEETLNTFHISMDDQSRQAILTDPAVKELEWQVAGLSKTLNIQKHRQAASIRETAPAPSTPSITDYFRLRESVFHTIQVLHKTKSAFRSKDLAGLRKYLEDVLRETTETLKNPESATNSSSHD